MHETAAAISLSSFSLSIGWVGNFGSAVLLCQKQRLKIDDKVFLLGFQLTVVRHVCPQPGTWLGVCLCLFQGNPEKWISSQKWLEREVHEEPNVVCTKSQVLCTW